MPDVRDARQGPLSCLEHGPGRLRELERAGESSALTDAERSSGLGWASIARMWLGDLDGSLATAAQARSAAAAALLLTARYREELRCHEDRHEAMAEALRRTGPGRAGPAILASGGTVILGLIKLLVAELNSTKGMGPVLAIGIAVALATMTTLLPASLVVRGRWVFWSARPR